MVEKAEGHELKLYWNTEYGAGDYYGYRVSSYRTNYYLVHYRGEAIELLLKTGTGPDTIYISKSGFIDLQGVDVMEIFKGPGDWSDLVMFRIPASQKGL